MTITVNHNPIIKIGEQAQFEVTRRLLDDGLCVKVTRYSSDRFEDRDDIVTLTMSVTDLRELGEALVRAADACGK